MTTVRSGASERSGKKIIFLDATRVHYQADATKEMSVKLLSEKQVVIEMNLEMGMRS